MSEDEELRVQLFLCGEGMGRVLARVRRCTVGQGCLDAVKAYALRPNPLAKPWDAANPNLEAFYEV